MNMSEMRIIKYSKETYLDPVALVGFPGVGLVSSILASFVIRELKMEVVAAISSSDFPPYTVILNGIPYPPIRVYGCKRESASDHCGDLIIVTSEVALKPEQHYELNSVLMGLFKEIGIKFVISIEGVPRYNSETDIFACGTSEASKERIKQLGLTELNDGLVRGLTGVMLYEAFSSGADVTALLCPANPALPDPRSAARILEPLSILVPELKIAAEPLYKEAEEIENRMRLQQEYERSVTPGDIQQLYR